MSSVTKRAQPRASVLQGTLDMLILRTLLYGPAHGHYIGKHIQRTTNDFLQMQHGSLYPALHRLAHRGGLTSKWEMAPDRNREFKYYRLTEKGRKQLVVEEAEWKQMAEAVARVMWPAAGENGTCAGGASRKDVRTWSESCNLIWRWKKKNSGNADCHRKTRGMRHCAPLAIPR